MDRTRGVIFSVAFRPFFLLGSAWSVVALGIWIVSFAGGIPLNTALPGVNWHIHAMLFGFVLAAIAGFILTAVANWTGRPPLSGAVLAALAGLWAVARILNLFSTLAPFWLIAAIDVAFPLALALLVARDIIAARSWRNLMMPVPIALLAVADAFMYLGAADTGVSPDLGWRLAVAGITTLISVVGARIVPAFTRNWLARRGETSIPYAHAWVDRIGSAVLHTGLLGWAFFPSSRSVAALLLAGALVTLARLVGWKGWLTRTEPLLLILHIGYLWMIIGAALLGVAILVPAVPLSAAVHALTAGAMGTMILAVMTRVTRGHTGRALSADALACVIYIAITFAGLSRVFAELITAAYQPLLNLAALLWIIAFLLFFIWAAPIVWRPRVDARAP